MDIEQIMDVDKVSFHQLYLGQDEQKEKEPLEVTQYLVPLPSDPMNVKAATKDETEEEGQTDMEIRLQKEVEKFEMYDQIYVGQLNEEETSDTEMDYSAYSYFD